MVYRIDYLNHQGKPMIKIFRVQSQAEDYAAFLEKHGYPSVTTSWDTTKGTNQKHKRNELQECLDQTIGGE